MKQEAIWILGGIGLLWLIERNNRTASIAGRMEKIRYVPVYSELPKGSKPGKLNIGFAKGKSGVYLIKEDDKIVYVGQSGYNLYETIRRHFGEWNDSNFAQRVSYRQGLKYNRYTVRIVFVSPTRALKLEEALIRKHRPRDNAAKLQYIDDEPDKVMAQKKILKEYEEQYTDVVPF